MLFAEPPPSQGDLRFRLFGFPIRIHPFFWLVTVLLRARGDTKPIELVVWVAVVLVSILVHELGHAIVQRRFGGHPRIVLLGLGGLAVCDDCDRSPGRQVLISLAGPLAGFLLAAVVIGIVAAAGHVVGFQRTGSELDWASLGISAAKLQPLVLVDVFFEPFESPFMNFSTADLLQVNIVWGVINLLPIYPLDGGRIARELMTLRNPRQGIIRSLQLSLGVAALVALYAISQKSLFTGVMFGMLAYSSYQALEAYRSHWR